MPSMMKPDASSRAARAARRADRRAAVMLLEAVKARSDAAKIARSVARRADAEEARRAAEATLLDIEGEIARSDAQAAAAEAATTSFDNLQRYAQDTLRDALVLPGSLRDALPKLGFEDAELLLRTALVVLPGHTNKWEFGDTTGLGEVCRRLVLWSEFMRWLDDTGRCGLASAIRSHVDLGRSPAGDEVWQQPDLPFDMSPPPTMSLLHVDDDGAMMVQFGLD